MKMPELMGARTGEMSPRILLVDDDPLFCRKIARVAKSKHMPLQICTTLKEVLALPQRPQFDVAVMDYHFGDLTAIELAHFVGEDTPIVLISNSDASSISIQNWPLDIRSFIHKSSGIEAVLSEVLLTALWPGLFDSAAEKSPVKKAKRRSLLWGAFFVPLLLAFLLPWVLPIWNAVPAKKNPIDLHPGPEEIWELSQPPVFWDSAPLPAGMEYGELQRKRVPLSS
jgi:CheY-like chemotaxis protein